MAVLRWSALHCSQTKFIFKLDNDCYIKVNSFIEKIETFISDTIYGRNFITSRVFRTGKWSIDKWYYPYKTYPQYHPGVYLIPGNMTVQLYEALVRKPTIDTIPALPFEDAFITGILAKKINALHAKFPGLELLIDRKFMNIFPRYDRENLDYLKTLTVYVDTLGDADMRKIWKEIGM